MAAEHRPLQSSDEQLKTALAEAREELGSGM
jgi:hypothetical protein